MSPELQHELLPLFSALCDGELTAAQQARLEELLEGDRACRRWYLNYLDMHAHLLVHPLYYGANTSDTRESCPTNAAVSAPLAAPVHAGSAAVLATVSHRGWQVPQLIRYGLAVAATLAASLLIQAIWRPPQGDKKETAKAGPGASKPQQPVYVATLTQTPACVWEHANDPGPVGPRLGPGALRLVKGIARIRFDTGSDLVVEGPTMLQLDSSTEATVFRGKVVFHADETAPQFDLHTPSSTLVNAGGEYAVSVGIDGEEVHVFDGEVQRLPKTGAAKPELVSAGQARSYGLDADAPGQPKVLDATGFVRKLASPGQPADHAAGLLAYEGFDYPTADALRVGKANGGFGWTSRWMGGFARPLLEGDTNLLALNVKESLVRPGAAERSVGGCFDYIGFAKYHRRLATPVRLDADGVYYLSFLFRREGPPADPLNALAILLRTTEELQKGKEDSHKRLNIGVGGANQLFTHLEKVGSRTPLPLRFGETYLLVAKIVASSSGPSQVFMRVYGCDEPIELEESGWTVTGPPLYSKLVFDWLEIHINSKTRQTIDEIRLGTTWSSVTGPWLGAAGVKKAGNPENVSGTVVQNTLRAVPAMVPETFSE
jgi:hypothetical protein